ncbi:MAG: hypothetical protein KDB27_32875 [Planctomycetales bacterium]|nr:hypothetical protein [Planctomycetales bacterium]
MREVKRFLHAGDLVEVRSAADIRATLDLDGCLDGLPFMPEMVKHCGQRFRVAYRALKTCVDGHPEYMREVCSSDIVFLEGLRCTGEHHSECARGCLLLWKSDWLRNVNNGAAPVPEGIDATEAKLLIDSLPTVDQKGDFFCQSTRMAHITKRLSKFRRIMMCFREVAVGNIGPLRMIKQVASTACWKIYGLLIGTNPKGRLSRTPCEVLDLQPGEMVEVKSYSEIVATLDSNGCNRGLLFGMDMRLSCGRRFKVARRLEQMICEDSGKMRPVKNTVVLEGVTCQCIFALGGCPRKEPAYWREIWLKRVSHVSPVSK